MSSLEDVAIHEAGHAVVAYLLGADLHTVTIVPEIEGPTLGSVIWSWWNAGEAKSVVGVQQQLRDQIAIALAGRAAAEALPSGELVLCGYGLDDSSALEWAQLLASDHPKDAPAVGAIIAAEWVRTVALVDGARHAITALAAALLGVDTFDGHDAWAIIDDAMNHRERIA